MNNESLEQRARELLAAEYAQDELKIAARRGDYDHTPEFKAIIRALESTPAQEVERHITPVGPVDGWCERCGCGNDSANFAHLPACVSARTAPADGDSLAFVNLGDSEANFIADAEHLNCQACGGSGHVDDATTAPVVGDGGVTKEQLDWLVANEYDLCTRRELINEDEYAIWWFVVDSRKSTNEHLHTVSGHPLGSPREAIDAAMGINTTRPAKAEGDATLRHPHTGELRDYRDVESDPEGKLCVGPGPLKAATIAPEAGDAQDATRYRWLRDVARLDEIQAFSVRRKTRLAADRLCDAGIDTARTVSRGDA